MARLEAYLAAWQQAIERRDTRGAADWEKTAVNQVVGVERVGNPFSSRQAEALLARSMTAPAAPRSIETLVRAAQAFYRGGQFDDAVSAYDQAARRAREAQDTTAAFDHAYSAATIQREREEFRDAIDRYRKLALLAPRTAEAHLLAVHCAAQLAQKQLQPKLDEYERLLREHVAKWPKGATASQAWWWLGRLEEHEQIYPEAIRALRNVAADDPQYAAAVEAVGHCYANWLSQLRQANKPSTQHAADAIRYFEQVIGPIGQMGQPPSDARRAAVLAAARLWLLEVPNGAAHAEELLRRSLGDAASAPPQWKSSAQSLLFLAVAAEGRAAEAEALLAQTPIGSPDEALALASTLGELTRRAAGQRKRSLAELHLRAIDDLLAKRDELEPAARTQAFRQRAAALTEAGRRVEAIAALEALAADNPRDGQTQEDLAALLMTDEPAELRKALVKWREIIGKSRPGSPRWFRAHYGLAHAELDLDNPVQARATIKQVESAHPDFGGAELKYKFQELLGQCDRRGTSSAGQKK